ncbi:hypothetical protein J5N97_021975 [Dioscorea zingiberensis]|uniref:C3H1-type domain-containing protein n=1 Tax=Dioscorea zingiberensis TaxID=325984 RepID=A0A9D5CAB0_9LILI|nr:hypothetical protein J5N97_021975 [Dioscorea zingiberensis]
MKPCQAWQSSASPETLVEKLENLKLVEKEKPKDEEKSDGECRERERKIWGKEDENFEVFQYPVRPGEPDCAYFLRNGSCGYGSQCKFNHPTIRNSRPQGTRWGHLEIIQAGEGKEIKACPQSEGQLKCKYYLMPGGCKYGISCKYGHHHQKAEAEHVDLNFLGLPIRPGEKECSYYLRTGCCKYSANCRFHHPEPVSVPTRYLVSGHHNDGYPHRLTSGKSQSPETSVPLQTTSPESFSSLDASSPSYIPRILLPHQVVHSRLNYSEYQSPAEASSTPDWEWNIQGTSAPDLICPPTKSDDLVRQDAHAEVYPERTNQPECQYFVKYGDCKFGSSCKFYHPKSRCSKASVCVLSPLGLPLRQDQPICAHYDMYGICKYGPSCKFDHPMNFVDSPSTNVKSCTQSSSVDVSREAEMTSGSALIQQS